MFLASKMLMMYVLPFLIVTAVYFFIKGREERKLLAIRDDEIEAGLTEPPTLHPVFDEHRCIGCRSCVEACPEKNVIGVIGGKASLISPAHCIGHGTCRVVCPVQAITLVFGTETRGIDIPFVQPNFETNVPGVFIAGELGGMGLIKNAVNQGVQALNAIHKQVKDMPRDSAIYDVVIVGAGPAGLAASLGALEKKMNYLTLEQETFGGAVAHYPRGKIVMTAPAVFPIVGKMKFVETTKEDILSYWEKMINTTGVEINYNQVVQKISKDGDLLLVQTKDFAYHTRTVLLAIGRMGTPRKLGVPGEDSDKVTYRLSDPEEYRDKNVLVVGGGDSALEAAASIAEVSRKRVYLSYRGEAFNRAKKKNRERVKAAQDSKKLKLILKSNVKEVRHNEVLLEHDGREIMIPNDAIIVCAGGVLPTGFLKDIGVSIDTKYGTE